jgi:hypothetical protein
MQLTQLIAFIAMPQRPERSTPSFYQTSELEAPNYLYSVIGDKDWELLQQ